MADVVDLGTVRALAGEPAVVYEIRGYERPDGTLVWDGECRVWAGPDLPARRHDRAIAERLTAAADGWREYAGLPVGPRTVIRRRHRIVRRE